MCLTTSDTFCIEKIVCLKLLVSYWFQEMSSVIYYFHVKKESSSDVDNVINHNVMYY